MFNNELKSYKIYGEVETIISNLSKINIFVGSNNSGKSRFLRNILTDKKLKFNFGVDELVMYNNLIKRANKEISAAFDGTPITEVGGIKCIDSLIKIEHLEEGDNSQLFLQLMDNLKSVSKKDIYSITGHSTNYNIESICEILNSIPDKYIKEFEDKKLNSYLDEKKFKRIYIPTLRGLRRLNTEEDLFEKRTYVDYFSNSEIEIFTGQNLYKEVLELLCGDFKSRKHLREFEEFLGSVFFEGKTLNLIPKIDSDVLYVKIGEEKEYPIYNLGDGIQSIIILTFKLFANKGMNMLFFIEEPELYLHPGLERKMIETFLNDDFSTYQYFMTTHSNHLLDLTLDLSNISIYKFHKEINSNGGLEEDAIFSIENVNDGDTSVLQSLGVNNSSIFLSNCTIWVEGITDRLYIRKFLSIYQKVKFDNKESKIYSEDIHYSFLEYSGGNITHWDFLDSGEGMLAPMKHNKICNRIFLIADSDGYNTIKKGMKSQRLETLENYFGEKFYCFKAKEIENILIPKIIKSTVFKLNDRRIKDPEKEQDGKLFNEVQFSIEDYKQINLGEFINDKINEIIELKAKDDINFIYKRKKDFQKGNSINKKIEFCKYAIEDITTLSDMSNDAVELCEKIYDFIKENNQ